MTINPTYLRVGFYFFAPMLGSLPGVTVDMAAGLITIDIDTAIAGITAGALASGWVFGKWGKK
jgi:hypothetical protein